MRFLRLSITSLFILALCSNLVVAQDDSIAFVGAKIIPIRGDEIEDGVLAVSYTHLTLPTICSV